MECELLLIIKSVLFSFVWDTVFLSTQVGGQAFLPRLCPTFGLSVINICPRPGWGMVLMMGVAGGCEVWLNLDFSTKDDKLSIGSRFKPEINIAYKIPREIYRQEIKPTGSCCWAVTCLQDSAWASQDACSRSIVASILPSEIPLTWFPHSPALSFDTDSETHCVQLGILHMLIFIIQKHVSSSELLIDLKELALSYLVDLIPAKKVMF